MENDRKFAMTWWNRLSSKTKTRLCDRHKEHLAGNPRRWETLTGSEIETIYKHEK